MTAKDILALVMNGGALFAVVIYYLYTQTKKPDTPVTADKSGDKPVAHWQREFDEIKTAVGRVESQRKEHIDALQDLTGAVRELTMTLLRGGK